MNISYCDNYKEMSLLAGTTVMEELTSHEDPLLCAATGYSTKGVYSHLVQETTLERDLLSNLRIIKLDEWGGLPSDHPSSCEYYLRNSLIDPLKIPAANYISFDSSASDPVAECSRIQHELDQQRPIHVSVLGLGTNGHVALIEPDHSLEPSCHVASIKEESLQHDMLQSLETKPAYGLTLGMSDILSSYKIVLLVSGQNKQPIIKKLLKEAVSSFLPASYLWTHPRVECIVDRESMQ